MHSKWLLERSVSLYNNIAEVQGLTGRLSADFQVYPSPAIRWEFEVLGASPGRIPSAAGEGKLLSGHGFTLECSESVRIPEWAWERFGGWGTRAWFGQLDRPVVLAYFYLPNARFHTTSQLGQRVRQAVIEELVEGQSVPVRYESWTAGLKYAGSLGNDYGLTLTTDHDAQEWLQHTEGNIGTLLTSVAMVYCKEPSSETVCAEFTLNKVLEHARLLSGLWTFANGGYLGPLVVEGVPRDDVHDRGTLAAIHPFVVTPLEQLATTWLCSETDLTLLMDCYPTFTRMMAGPPWGEAYPLVVTWYLQALQPENGNGSPKPWPVVVSALGTALERLAYAILVEEERNADKRIAAEKLFSGGGRSRERLWTLLRRVGLPEAGQGETYHNPPHQDIVDFVTLRNDAVHPKRVGMSDWQRAKTVRSAAQWVEEILLWRLGYGGQYRNRRAVEYSTTLPRYELRSRCPEW